MLVAVARYGQGDFPGAIEAARAGLPIAPNALFYPKTATAVYLVRALLAQGKVAEARIAIAENARLIDLSGAEMLRPINVALDALADLADGEIDRAARWAGAEPRFGPDNGIRPFEHPVVTQARVWLARNRPGDVERATAALEILRNREAEIHFAFALGWTLPVLAVAHARLGAHREARAALRDALALEPGRMTRRFADAGPEAISLLEAVAANPADSLASRAAAVLAGISPSTLDAGRAAAAPNPLSLREVEILSMMADWRTNKEIAEALGISAATVHNHSIRIFRKLGVGDRRDAVDAARAARWLAG
jgi:LuxR family transcriptional regulator, maltose regulon positive regulatory protein